jgi:hypothetical protein
VETRNAFSGEFSKGTIHQVVETLIPGEQEPVKIEQYLDREYIYMLAPGKDGKPEWVRSPGEAKSAEEIDATKP